MSHTVHLRGVTKRYRSTVALDDVTLDVGPGVTGLLGPNGAGKTTLLRIVATALAPNAGQVETLGQRPDDAAGRLAIRRRLGYVPQDLGLYPSFTAYDFVDYVAILKEIEDPRVREDEVCRVLEAVGLGADMHRKTRTLSGGMRRRVGLAQALLGSPDLLVLDEPTVGLDPAQRLRFREVISQAGRDRVVLLSTHLTEDVSAMCGRVVVIDEGRVLFSGTPRELASLADGRVWLAAERDPGAELCWLTADGRYRHIGAPARGGQPVEPTLEDGYLTLVGDRAVEAVAL